MPKDVPVVAKGKLQVAKISSAVNRNHIKCTCVGGPPNGENIVLCRVCNEWHHQRCQIGMGVLLPRAAIIKGHICPGCKVNNRSSSGKNARARDKAWRDEGIAQRTAMAAGTNGKVTKNTKRRSGIGAKKTLRRTRGNDDDEDEYDEDENGVMPDFDDEHDSDVGASPRAGFEDEGDNMTLGDPRYTSNWHSEPAASTRARRQTARNHRGYNMGMINNHSGGPSQLNAKDKKRVRRMLDLTKKEPCQCLGDVVEAGTTLAVCYDCGALHREGCAGDPHTDNFGKGNFCRHCRALRLHEMQEASKWFEMKKIHDRDIAFARKLEAEEEREEDEREEESEMEGNEQEQEDPEGLLKSVCAGYLWNAYALQPTILTTSPVVKELTACTFDMGERQLVPVHHAPASFVNQLYTALREMFDAAGDDNVKKIGGHDMALLSPDNPEQMLKGLRQLGFMVVYRTEKRMTLREMGVLAEVLGLASKGTSWRG